MPIDGFNGSIVVSMVGPIDGLNGCPIDCVLDCLIDCLIIGLNDCLAD